MSEERKRPGRPSVDPFSSGSSIQLSVRLSPRQYDALCAAAKAQRTSTQDVIRARIARDLIRKLDSQ